MDVPGLFQEKNTKQEWIPERLLQHLPAGSRRAGGSEELREVLVVPAPPVGRPGGPYEVTWGVCPLLSHPSELHACPHPTRSPCGCSGRREGRAAAAPPRGRICALCFTPGLSATGVGNSGVSFLSAHSTPSPGCVRVSFGGIPVEMRSPVVSCEPLSQIHVYQSSGDAGRAFSWLARVPAPCWNPRGGAGCRGHTEQSALRRMGWVQLTQNQAGLHGAAPKTRQEPAQG